MDAYVEGKEHRGGDVDSWSVPDKRIRTTHVVAEAWEAFRRDKKELKLCYE